MAVYFIRFDRAPHLQFFAPIHYFLRQPTLLHTILRCIHCSVSLYTKLYTQHPVSQRLQHVWLRSQPLAFGLGRLALLIEDLLTVAGIRLLSP